MIVLDALAAVDGIRHGFFTREGGVSQGLYASKNCGFGSGDARANVERNRAQCVAELGADAPALVTVHQTHSADVVKVAAPWRPEAAVRADGLVTDRPDVALGILTADCAAVLMVDPAARTIGAAHAGWKGALGGIIEATVATMVDLGARPDRIVAAVGPCIGPRSYEVGPEFRDRFVEADAGSADLFASPPAGDRLLFDLRGCVERRLAACGVDQVSSAMHDTFAEEARFFSYRRSRLRGEPDYGRCLSAIVIDG